MKVWKITRIAVLATVPLTALLLVTAMAAAQSADLQGVIDGRSGATMTVKSARLRAMWSSC